jgi:hypothetical protein
LNDEDWSSHEDESWPMASLALLVTIIFLGMLLFGPLLLLLNKLNIFPKIIIQFLSIICAIYGLWWIITLVTPIRWLGLFPIYCAYLAIKSKEARLDNR